MKRLRFRRTWRVDDARGSFTIWALGLAVTLLFVGGIAIDCWRMFGARRDLVQATEAAARAGASAIDEDRLRNDGILTMDTTIARGRAQAALSDPANNARLTAAPDIRVDGFQVTVRAETTIELPLIGLLSPGGARRTIAASAVATPAVG